jgi:Flp pilus assembly pilin Flp
LRVLWLAEALAGEWRLTEGDYWRRYSYMFKKMSFLEFLKNDQGSVAIEYVILVAGAAILLGVGVAALMNAMSGYFSNWADFFNSGS